MIFSSIYFVFLFLPIVLALYYAVPQRFLPVRNAILLLASLVFYAYGEPVFVFVLMGSVIVNYLIALLLERKKSKLLLTIDVILNIGLLFVYKYLNFFVKTVNDVAKTEITVRQIVLPIGISFFTFQALSYVIDVYRGEKAQHSLPDLALYICFFPQLIAGPIVRYHDVATQLRGRGKDKDREKRQAQFAAGVERFLIGFSKKVLLANQLAILADDLFARESAELSTGMAWLGSICFSLQIYYDFSGYSDMAIGLGRMFGFEFLENFDHPYVAESITDFWRRWHMSLSRWFRDYVYIPLGGSKKGKAKLFRNLFVVWLLTGIWHGANYTFLCWGLLYFVFLTLEKFVFHPEKLKNKAGKLLYRLFTLAVVNFLWVLFKAEDIASGFGFIRAMFSGKGSVPEGFYVSSFREYGIFLAAAILFCLPVRTWLLEKGGKDGEGIAAKVAGVLYPLLLMLLFLWAVSYLILGAHNPFLYFNF